MRKKFLGPLIYLGAFIFTVLAWGSNDCRDQESPTIQSSLIELSKATSGCAFPELINSARTQKLSSVNIIVQLGYIDNPPKTSDSYDSIIAAGIRDYLTFEGCGFVKNSDGILEKSFHDPKQEPIILKISLITSSNNGKYDPNISNTVLKNLPDRLKAADFFVYIGHSRYGAGMDFFPQHLFQATRAVPIYQKIFWESLPGSIKGIALLACDPVAHATAGNVQSVAKNKKIQFIGADRKVFNFQDSTIRLIEVLNQFVIR